MIAEEQFQRGPPRFMNFHGLAFDRHPGLNFRRARWDELAFDFDQTDQAGRQWAALFKEAERWDIDPDFSGRIENALSR
jgi:hypothetical protein